ncbi:MAG: hypothetical protein QOE70_6804 [Chthoniobacter sp.]|jgi:hypothetical protein|nr:hypothetical protein [Chthoniobacter sp.]
MAMIKSMPANRSSTRERSHLGSNRADLFGDPPGKTHRSINPLLGVQFNADGSLEGWNELDAQDDPEKSAEGSLVLVAQWLGLLLAFIGESLTLRMLHEVWPRRPRYDFDSGKGDGR